MTADEIIALLDLQPHPEGGWYRETFRDARTVEGRSAGTAIYFLLRAGERSHWHRVDATEIWHWHAGGALKLEIEGAPAVMLGPDLEAGQRPQGIVPAGVWQAAEPMGDWVLVGCTVSPGFEFSGFELAAPGVKPF